MLTKVLFGIRFLRKCSAGSEEWEDVGDIIAREKTSQVLRDAIQARKSFSRDAKKFVSNDTPLHAEARRKDPHGLEKTTVPQSFQPSRHKIAMPQWRNNHSLRPDYRNNDRVYSPGYPSLHPPPNSYGRVPMSDPGNPTEDVPNASTTSSFLHQFPVTPNSSSIALSTGRKRPRHYQESPLIQGYHQYPYPTPIRSVNAQSSPGAITSSTAFTTPKKTKTRGLTFSPPTKSEQQAGDDLLPSRRHISELQAATKEYPVEGMALLQRPAPPAQNSKEVPLGNRSGDENQQDSFDSLLTDDVLSDSDSKNNSTLLFSPQDDLTF